LDTLELTVNKIDDIYFSLFFPVFSVQCYFKWNKKNLGSRAYWPWYKRLGRL